MAYGRMTAGIGGYAKRRGGVVLISLTLLVLVAAHLDAVPFWDAKNYLGCVETVQLPFGLLNFRCFGHSSIAYLSLWALTQYVRPWSPAAIYVTNGLLGVLSIAAFDALVRRQCPDRRDIEYTLVAALYGLAPLFVAHAIFLNVDYGATVFYVLFLSCLFAERFWAASACAVALVFTKETGAAAFGVTVAAYVTAFTFDPRRSWSERASSLRSQAPLLTVPLTFIAYVLLARNPAGWFSAYAPAEIVPGGLLQTILDTNLADPGIRSFLTDIFVLNFQWLYTAVIVAAICWSAIRIRRPGTAAGLPSRQTMFDGLVLAGLVYMVTRFRFSNNARYVLLTSPILILVFYRALLSLAGAAAVVSYLGVCAVLVFSSNFRTFDPASRSIFGTFSFGSHAILDMPSLMGGLKLDCLVYDLEFLQLQYLFGDLVRDVRPPPGAVLLMGNAVYNFPPDVDGRTYALTANPAHAVPYFVAIGDVRRQVLESHITRDGDPFFYVVFPNADNVQLQGLLKEYALVGMKTYERRGYVIELYTFRFTFKRDQ